MFLVSLYSWGQADPKTQLPIISEGDESTQGLRPRSATPLQRPKSNATCHPAGLYERQPKPSLSMPLIGPSTGDAQYNRARFWLAGTEPTDRDALRQLANSYAAMIAQAYSKRVLRYLFRTEPWVEIGFRRFVQSQGDMQIPWINHRRALKIAPIRRSEKLLSNNTSASRTSATVE